MIMGCSLLLVPTALWLDGLPSLELMTSTWVALLVLAVLCTSVSSLLYFNILKCAGSRNLILVTLLIPPIAIGLGVTFLEESLQGTALMGFALIALGVTIINGRLWVLFSPKR